MDYHSNPKPRPFTETRSGSRRATQSPASERKLAKQSGVEGLAVGV